MTYPTPEQREHFKEMFSVIKPEHYQCQFFLGHSVARIIAYKVNDKYYFTLESFHKIVAVLDTSQNVLLNAATKRSARHMRKFHDWIREYLGITNIKEIRV